MIRVGGNGVSEIRIGGTAIREVYAGSHRVFCAGTGGKFVGCNGKDVYVSHDGETWEKRTLDIDFDLGKLAFGNGIYVSVRSDPAVIAYSFGGYKWSRATLPAGVSTINGIMFGGGKFVAFGEGEVLVSSDGMSWTRHAVGKGFVAVSGTYSPSVGFVAVGGNMAYVSSDGVNWSGNAAYGAGTANQIIFNGSRFYAAVSTCLYDSYNGLAWIRSLSDDDDVKSVSCGNGVVFASGASKSYVIGGVGTRVQSMGTNFAEIAFGGGKFVATTRDMAYISADCTDFSILNVGGSIHHIVYGS